MGGPSVPQAPQLTGQGYADQTYQSQLGALTGYSNQGGQLAQNVVNNPYAGQALQGATSAANYLTNSAVPQMQGASNALYGSAGAALPQAQQILNAGFDPQNALYQRTQQQVGDQTNAALAASGVAQTPYGASVAAQNNANFNIDWQNQQLGRETQAAQGYGSLVNSALGQYGAASGLGGQAATGLQQAGSLPYSTQNAIQSAGLGALGQAAGLTGQAQQGAGQYLGLSNQNYQDQLQAYQAQLQQYLMPFQALGSLAGLGSGANNSTLGGQAIGYLGGLI